MICTDCNSYLIITNCNWVVTRWQ